MARRSASLLFCGALVACVRAAPVVAPVDVTVGTSAPSSAQAPGPAKDRCTARLVTGEVDTNTSCFLDENVTKSDGVLTFPCRGDGPVEAVFGTHHFEGEVRGGKLSLSLKTELDWDDDRCRWESRQAIRGEIRAHELAWTYVDQPVRGPDGTPNINPCGTPCTARATVQVDPKAGARKAPRPGRLGDDDDDEPDP